MVYYGAISRGCERCRRRKVKCDERKPQCLKCEMLQKQCPGYRDLNRILFRDETKRIAQKSRKEWNQLPKSRKTTSIQLPILSLISTRVLYPLAQPIDEYAANFYFSKYIFVESPFSEGYYAWLAQSYSQNGHILRTAIEAVGLAAISNMMYAPRVATRSKIQYCKTLTCIRRAIDNPIEATSDSTLMAVILVVLFETIHFEVSDRYEYWAAHVKGAMTLLQLRGREQFATERGGQLYLLIRPQILLICMQQRISVPTALIETSYRFQTSTIRRQWQEESVASPNSIFSTSFRVIDIAATLEGGQAVQEAIRDINNELESWKAGLLSHWNYTIMNGEGEVAGDQYSGMVHSYPSLWIAEAWNNWRILRIMVNQLILQNEVPQNPGYSERIATAISVIQEMCSDICISVPSFGNTQRILSLIRPLYVVALEGLNPEYMRTFAVERLRHIGASMGIRQACLLADSIIQKPSDAPSSLILAPCVFKVPLIPFC
ncbi:hypothetical protein CC78DRAFT_28884 [Lojkania enalia]|uniref:Zn(2)-C6 fungal-type domain-containing protein n=1 Tax=Lojkania enalia TaxID=147567 RepID=A0A9P4K1B1_9PLEO|nr:hypothetical protein CC78DRAFT_28884 [Didymosphaeria enalia]